MYNLRPGATLLGNFQDIAATDGIDSFANQLLANDAALSAKSDADLAAQITTNLGLTGDVATAGDAYLVGQFAANPSARGKVILDAMNALATLEGDATYGAAAALFNADVVASLEYSSVATNTDTAASDAAADAADAAADAADAAATSTVYSFTTGLDALVGSAGADTFNAWQTGATTETLSVFDSADGGDGDDTITIINSDAAAYNGASISNIENVVYRSTAASGDLDFDDLGSDVTAMTLKSTVGANDVTNMSTSTALTFESSKADMDTTVTYKASTVTGATDTATITLNGVNDGADIELASDVETINIVASGADSRLNDLVFDAQTTTVTVDAAVALRVDDTLTAAGVTSVTVTGAGDVRFDDDFVAVTTYDASAATGAQYIEFAGTTNATVTGGTGDDTFDFAGTFTKADTLDGGDGDDVLLITPTANISGDISISNIEELQLGDVAASTTVDLDNMSLNTIRQNAGTASNITTLQDLATSITTVNYVGAGTTAAQAFDTVILDYDSTTDVDSVVVNISNAGVDSLGNFTVVTGSEFDGANGVAINITEAGTGTGDIATLNTINADSANSITINSNTDVSLTIAGMGGQAATDRLSDVDMTGSDAGITLTISSDDDATVTLGNGTNDFNGGAGDETIIGGSGVDTIEADGGNDTITLGDGIDIVEIDISADGTTTITDFVAGNGGDILTFQGTNDAAGTGIVTTTFTLAGNGGNTYDLVSGMTIIDNNDGTNTDTASFSTTDVAAYLASTDGAGDDVVFSNSDNIAYIAVSDGVDTAIFTADDTAGNTVIDAGDLVLIITLEGIADAGTLTTANFSSFI